ERQVGGAIWCGARSKSESGSGADTACSTAESAAGMAGQVSARAEGVLGQSVAAALTRSSRQRPLAASGKRLRLQTPAPTPELRFKIDLRQAGPLTGRDRLDCPTSPDDPAPMPLSALALVLLAACTHATWNLSAKRAAGCRHFVFLYSALSIALYLPVISWILWTTRPDFGLQHWLALLGSGVLHLGYS